MKLMRFLTIYIYLGLCNCGYLRFISFHHYLPSSGYLDIGITDKGKRRLTKEIMTDRCEMRKIEIIGGGFMKKKKKVAVNYLRNMRFDHHA